MTKTATSFIAVGQSSPCGSAWRPANPPGGRTVLPCLLAGALVLLAPAAPASAHHAFSAEFDANRPLQLRGTVARTEWINPHSWIHVDVTGDDGTVTTWAIECGAPNSLMRRGLNKNSIPAGTELVIDGFGAKDGSNTANARDITFPDGSRFFVGSSGTGAPYERNR